MKKNLLNWMTILMVAIVSVGFMSCNSDNDADDSKASIFGTWRNDSSDGYDLITFNANGKGTYSEYYYEGKKELLKEVEAFDYIFNESSMTLRMLFGDEVEIWKVESLTSKQMVIDGEVFVKQ